MGIFFTSLYIFGALLTPEILYGDIAQYHIQVVFAVLALAFGLAQSGTGAVIRLPQSIALICLIGCVCMSLMANGFFGGAVDSLVEFLPNALAFFYVALNCKKKGHLQVVIVAALLPVFFVIGNGIASVLSGNFVTPYFISQNVSNGVIYRLRGNGLINDPNDFAQLSVALIPLTFFFWKRGSYLLNLLLVYVPVGYILYGLYLTHSRGVMLALLFCIMLAVRRRIGTVAALVISAAGFLGLEALNWSGGRDVSAAGGEDRMEAWSSGLEMIKGHPIFGVGYHRFTDFYYITAHNTVVVCAAEIGVVGFFVWVWFVLPCILDASQLSHDPAKKRERKADTEPLKGLPYGGLAHPLPLSAAGPPLLTPMHAPMRMESQPAMYETLRAAPASGAAPRFDDPDDESEAVKAANDAETRRLGTLVLLSLAGYLVAGWFLSRAFQLNIFIFAGMAVVVASIGRKRGLIGPPATLGKSAVRAAGVTFVLVAIVYLILRLDHLLPK